MSVYDKNFYDTQRNGSVASADIVVPLLLREFEIRSVVDVGCGMGTWLSVFEKHGVKDILGLDGSHVPQSELLFDPAKFRAEDLSQLASIGRRFDLACSLEVAEHLPSARSEAFVAALVEAAPVVMFSAAIPGQGGTYHINERWQSEWQKIFAKHGYECIDLLRPRIHSNDRVEWWYRQNVLVFCAPGRRPERYQAVTDAYELDRVHPILFDIYRENAEPNLMRALKAVARKAIGR